MNDDLIGMLRELGDKDFLNRPDPFVSKNAAAKFRMAADRIEELEDKMALAVRALEFIGCDDGLEGKHARTILAKLTGGKDER